MFKSILALINAISSIVSWFFSPKQIAKREDAEVQKVQNDKDAAVLKGDEDKVNARINDILKVVVLSGLLLAVAGCCTPNPSVAYIQDSDKVVFMAKDGRPGWWVPTKVFGKLLNDAEAYKKIKEAK